MGGGAGVGVREGAAKYTVAGSRVRVKLLSLTPPSPVVTLPVKSPRLFPSEPC